MRLLTDRGLESCGPRTTHHEYEWYSIIEEIEQTRTKARSPKLNGTYERCHKAIGDKFYKIAFSKKTYTHLKMLQDDVDFWVTEHNNKRTDSARDCFGKTPTQGFLGFGSKHLV